jgi:transposase
MDNIINLQEIIAKKDARIAELEALVKYYEEQFRLSRSRQYGNKSEKYIIPPTQLHLFGDDDVDINLDEPEPEYVQITYKRRKRVGKRKDDLSVLPVETVVHNLPENEQTCPECGGKLHVMGHEIRQELKIIPAKVMVVKHEQSVYSCRGCEKTNDHVPIIKAPTPAPVIMKSLASPSAVAYIMTQKYTMHLPLYRQELNWKLQGVYLSRQTMASWVIRCANDWLKPIYEIMVAGLLKREILHADETVIQTLNEPGRAPTSDSYMWLYRTSGDAEHHIIIYEYQPGRGGIYPKQFLTGFKGILHCDGYAAYHTLPLEITLVGCWVHMRRKFVDALKAIPEEQRASSIAMEAIYRIGKLFHLESKWADLEADKRYELRLMQSKPLADKFFNWLGKLTVLPKSASGKAVNYAQSQYKWLMNVYTDGRAEFSNNRIENSARCVAVGRKNYLFCNTVNGAKASAIVYSIIETAKANGIRPFEYLEFLFETLPNTKDIAFDSLLPWGEAIPEYCRIPADNEGAQNAEKKRNGFFDRICSGIFGREA